MRWSASLDPVRPALLRAGRGTGWWWPGVPVVADGRRIWVLAGSSVVPVTVDDAEQVLRDDGELLVLGDVHWMRVGPSGTRRGRLDRPGAPVSHGGVRWWIDQGFVYRSAGGAPRVIDALQGGDRVSFGPGGALLAGVDGWTRGGLPGRSPRPLGRPLLPAPVRWSDDGRTVFAVDEDEVGVIIDLASGHVTEADGAPVAADTWLRGTTLVRGDEVLRRDVSEASCARWSDRLAGPGGRVWSLATGRPVGRRGVVALGVTVGTPHGFVTVHWATHRGWTVDPEGSRRDPFRLPLDDDDTVVAGIWADGAVHLATALGKRLRVVGDRVEPGDVPVDPPDAPDDVDTPAGPFVASGTADVGRHRFAWNDDGWLLAWPR